jgi:hypothetical protein
MTFHTLPSISPILKNSKEEFKQSQAWKKISENLSFLEYNLPSIN